MLFLVVQLQQYQLLLLIFVATENVTYIYQDVYLSELAFKVLLSLVVLAFIVLKTNIVNNRFLNVCKSISKNYRQLMYTIMEV